MMDGDTEKAQHSLMIYYHLLSIYVADDNTVYVLLDSEILL